MNPQAAQHTSTWVTFTYASFIGALLMVAAGVVLMPMDLWIKGYFAMGIVMLIQSCITLTKTIRDVHESGKLVNRIEDAKAFYSGPWLDGIVERYGMKPDIEFYEVFALTDNSRGKVELFRETVPAK